VGAMTEAIVVQEAAVELLAQVAMQAAEEAAVVELPALEAIQADVDQVRELQESLAPVVVVAAERLGTRRLELSLSRDEVGPAVAA